MSVVGRRAASLLLLVAGCGGAPTAASPGGGEQVLAVIDLRGPARDVSLRQPSPAPPPPLALPASLSKVETKTSTTLILREGTREVWREEVTSLRKRDGFRAIDPLRLEPGAEGFVELHLSQAAEPNEGDEAFRPGPPLRLVFKRGPDGTYRR